MNITRRRLLSATAAVAGTGMLAGCIGGGATADPEASTAQATFFVFGDIAEKVAGDATTTNLLVPVGQHGHGWEPGPSVREDIRTAELLLHGMSGFQPWVDSILPDLEVDAPELQTVDVSSGLELLEAGADHNHTDDEHDEETHSEHNTDDEEHEEDHNEGPMDPHFWMDPLRVKEATGTVREAFVDIDPDNADAYDENTAAFRDDLDTLHEQIETVVADGSQDVLLVAGHNSVQYFGDRYGVTVEALTDVSPDDQPTPSDIDRAQDIIDEHDLQYICADPLESQEAAEQLVEETDAEAVLPLTAMPGLTEEWTSEEWGYIDVMTEVNIPTLESALDT